MTTNTHLWSYLPRFFSEWEMFQTNGVEKSKQRFCVHKHFFKKTVQFMRYYGKILNRWTGHRWQHGACALDVGYIRLQTHTLRIRNTYCFSTATMVAQMWLNVMLYVLSSFYYNMVNQHFQNPNSNKECEESFLHFSCAQYDGIPTVLLLLNIILSQDINQCQQTDLSATLCSRQWKYSV